MPKLKQFMGCLKFGVSKHVHINNKKFVFNPWLEPTDAKSKISSILFISTNSYLHENIYKRLYHLSHEHWLLESNIISADIIDLHGINLHAYTLPFYTENNNAGFQPSLFSQHQDSIT